MCEITSIGLISAARTTMPTGRFSPVGLEERVVGVARGDLRSAFTHSLTPRLRVLCFAAVGRGG